MNKILLIIAFLLTSQSAQAASLSKPPNNLGLVGYWSFNDCRGLKATDFSGYGNHGALTDGPSWGTGRVGCALNFDGANDIVTMPAATESMAEVTIALWVNPQTVVGQYGVVNNWNGPPYAYLTRIATGGVGYQFYTYTPAGQAGGTFAGTIAPNKWTHLVATYDGATMRVYFDGQASATTVAQTGAINAGLGIQLGMQNYGYFPGMMDEVRIYSRALGATEVARLYSLGEAKVRSSSSEAGSGLVAHWKFDERSGATTADSVGGNTGTLTNGPSWGAGKLGGGLNFDGTNDYIVSQANIGLSADPNITMSAWVNLTDATGGYVLSTGVGGIVGNFLLSVTSTGITVAPDNVRPITAAVAIAPGQWYHVAFTKPTGLFTDLKIYLNGVSQAITSGNTGNNIILGASPLYIGSQQGAATFFKGKIDDARVYNRVLTAEEVRLLYSVGTTRPPLMNVASNRLTAGTSLASGLVGHWTFDGRYLNTTTATDTSGSANHGTLTNGPAPVIGKMGQALSFDGSNDYINAGRPAFFDESPTKLTLSAWIKPTSISGYQAILGSFTGSIPYYFLGMGAFYGSPNALNVQFRNNSAVMNVSAVAPSIETGKWSHVTVVWDGSQPRLTFYVDGAQISTTTTNILTSMDPLAAPRLLGIGGDGGGAATSVFPGTIDDVRIYTRALTSTEVNQLYNLGR